MSVWQGWGPGHNGAWYAPLSVGLPPPSSVIALNLSRHSSLSLLPVRVFGLWRLVVGDDTKEHTWCVIECSNHQGKERGAHGTDEGSHTLMTMPPMVNPGPGHTSESRLHQQLRRYMSLGGVSRSIMAWVHSASFLHCNGTQSHVDRLEG